MLKWLSPSPKAPPEASELSLIAFLYEHAVLIWLNQPVSWSTVCEVKTFQQEDFDVYAISALRKCLSAVIGHVHFILCVLFIYVV